MYAKYCDFPTSNFYCVQRILKRTRWYILDTFLSPQTKIRRSKLKFDIKKQSDNHGA